MFNFAFLKQALDPPATSTKHELPAKEVGGEGSSDNGQSASPWKANSKIDTQPEGLPKPTILPCTALQIDR